MRTRRRPVAGRQTRASWYPSQRLLCESLSAGPVLVRGACSDGKKIRLRRYGARPGSGWLASSRPRIASNLWFISASSSETVPLQPRLEADVLPGRRRPGPAREMAPTRRPPKRPYRTSDLEPDRHTVQQRTSSTLAPALHARHLDVRHDPVGPSRYRHTTPPACSPLTTRFTVREVETAGFDVKRLDWMTKDSIRPQQTRMRPQGLQPPSGPCQRTTSRKTPGQREGAGLLADRQTGRPPRQSTARPTRSPR